MNERVAVTFGALLHDIGKVVYRSSSEVGTHSALGASFLRDDVFSANPPSDEELASGIIDQVRFHHAKELSTAHSLSDDSLAYITYFADNISAGMDRKSNEGGDGARRFDKDIDLSKIFNILNRHSDSNTIRHDDYNLIKERIKKGLLALDFSEKGIGSLINLLEATTDSVPSSTNKAELVDVSLFDHSKTTAGLALCILDYLDEKGESNRREALFTKRSEQYYEEKMFLLYSCDMSGIQDFIYTISGSGALKQLRARSLYLELLMEHVVDELLDRSELSRSNLLYVGGGHAYLILPNTTKMKRCLADFEEELQKWFLKLYRTDLYLAGAWVECCANDLSNKGGDGGRYARLFRILSEGLSDRKSCRYSADTIRRLNFGDGKINDHGRECTECHRSDVRIDESGKCALCSALGAISASLVKKSVFAIMRGESGDKCLELPFGCHLELFTRSDYLSQSPQVLRVYTKNSWDTGIALSTHIWMGDYTASVNNEADRFSSYASCGVSLEDGKGIKRLGVLRADVDNLGLAFSNGFPRGKASISRTATLSRALNYYFKFLINEVLEAGCYRVQVIYSGGDDLFLIGNWSDLIFAAVDIRRSFEEYIGNDSLTISAGLGMFDEKYPISRMAEESGDLESAAKLHIDQATGKSKDAIALWTRENVFSWQAFRDEIVPLFNEITLLFQANEKGKSFIYKLHALLRSFDDTASLPRLAYLLARTFEGIEPRSSQARNRIYSLSMNERSRRYLIVAMEWYVYSIRERG